MANLMTKKTLQKMKPTIDEWREKLINLPRIEINFLSEKIKLNKNEKSFNDFQSNKLFPLHYITRALDISRNTYGAESYRVKEIHIESGKNKVNIKLSEEESNTLKEKVMELEKESKDLSQGRPYSWHWETKLEAFLIFNYLQENFSEIREFIKTDLFFIVVNKENQERRGSDYNISSQYLLYSNKDINKNFYIKIDKETNIFQMPILLTERNRINGVTNHNSWEACIENSFLLIHNSETSKLNYEPVKSSDFYSGTISFENILEALPENELNSKEVINNFIKSQSKNNILDKLSLLYRIRETKLEENRELIENQIEIKEDSVQINFPVYKKEYGCREEGVRNTLKFKKESTDIYSLVIFNDNSKPPTFLLNGQRFKKDLLAKDTRYIKVEFPNLPKEIIGNRLNNFLEFLRNPYLLPVLIENQYLVNDKFMPLKIFAKLIMSDKVESFITVKDSIPAYNLNKDRFTSFSQEREIYNLLFDLFDDKQLVRDTKLTINNLVPSMKFLLNCDSFESLFGIRILDIKDDGIGERYLNMIKSYSKEQISEVGTLLFHIFAKEAYFKYNYSYNKNFDIFKRELRYFFKTDNSNLFFKIANIEYDFLKFMKNSSGELLKFISTNNDFNSLITELKLLNSLLGEMIPSDDIINLDITFLKDSLNMHYEISKDLSIKDFVDNLNYFIKKNDDFAEGLFEYHDKLSSEYKVIEDKIKNKKYNEILSKLKKLSYKGEKFEIRPANSIDEIIKEGQELKHCVASYIPRVLNETEKIFVLRELEKLNKPYFTIGIVRDKITQVNGFGNQSLKPDSEEAKLIKKFAKANKMKINILNWD